MYLFIYFYCILYLYVSIIKISSIYLFAYLSYNYFYSLNKCKRTKRTSTRNSISYVLYCVFIPLRLPPETGEHLTFLAALFEVFIFQTVQILHCVPLAFLINSACVRASGFFADIKISNICTYMQYATCFHNFLLAHSTLYFRF